LQGLMPKCLAMKRLRKSDLGDHQKCNTEPLVRIINS
jgi:hypothetical protein